MSTEIAKIVKSIIAKFRTLNGASFVGIGEYLNSHNELANYVVIADFNYGNAVSKTVDTLNSLVESDFQAIAEKYAVCNIEGTRYCNGAVNQQKYIVEGKELPKEGTKAREQVLKSIKVTKTLQTVCNEMVNQFIANKDKETRSTASQSAIDAYERITNSIKLCIETRQLHIYALAHSKVVLQEGEYADSEKYLETQQKEAIARYCKYQLGSELTTEKYRNFIIDPEKLVAVAVAGETVSFA